MGSREGAGRAREVRPRAREAEAKPITLGAATERYETAKARKRSLAGDLLIIKRLLAHFGKETRLDKITAEAISSYRDGRLSGASERRKNAEGKPTPLAAGTVNRELALLRHLLRLAHEEWGALATVPRVRLAKEPEGRIRWLEPAEEAALLAACGKSKNTLLAGIVTLALETGMRPGEIMGLTWERVELSRGVLRLERMRGGSLQALQTILGHATLAMTSRYAHLSPEFLRKEIERTAAPISTQSAHEGAQAVEGGAKRRK